MMVDMNNPAATRTAKRRGQPATAAAPDIAAAERDYRQALAAEVDAVDALDDRSSARQVAHARELADRTNAALRAWQAARGQL